MQPLLQNAVNGKTTDLIPLPDQTLKFHSHPLPNLPPTLPLELEKIKYPNSIDIKMEINLKELRGQIQPVERAQLISINQIKAVVKVETDEIGTK